MSYGTAVHEVIAGREGAVRRRLADESGARRSRRQEHAAAARWVKRYMPDCCHDATGEPHGLVVDAAYWLRDQLRRNAAEFGTEDRRPTPDEVRYRIAQWKPWLLDEIAQWRTT